MKSYRTPPLTFELLDEGRAQGSRCAFLELFERLDDCRLLSTETAVEVRAWSPVAGPVLATDFGRAFRELLAVRSGLSTPERLKPRHDKSVCKRPRSSTRQDARLRACWACRESTESVPLRAARRGEHRRRNDALKKTRQRLMLNDLVSGGRRPRKRWSTTS